MSIVNVQPSRDIIQAIPAKAQNRIKSSLSVKFLRYHVETPRIEQADMSSHHPSGMDGATPSPLIGMSLIIAILP